jgi:hypothetical protein
MILLAYLPELGSITDNQFITLAGLAPYKKIVASRRGSAWCKADDLV